MWAMKRVGHKGADLIAPGNTIASFEAALAAGVDMIEFDVLSERLDGSGALWLVHDYTHAREHPPIELEEGLAHFAAEAYADIELDVDLKLPGYERRVVEALRAHDLVERTIVSTMEIASLRALREIEPTLRIGWSIPRVRVDYLSSPWTRYRRWRPWRSPAGSFRAAPRERCGPARSTRS